jgi:hypothetical protein
MIIAAYSLHKWLILNKSLLNYYLDVSVLECDMYSICILGGEANLSSV